MRVRKERSMDDMQNPQGGQPPQGEPPHQDMKQKVKGYKPLAVIFVFLLIFSVAIAWRSDYWMWKHWLSAFMGSFFLIFSMFKFFDLKGFVEGYSVYDLIAKKTKMYAYCYPFIEVALGIAYLSFFIPVLTNIVTIIIMAISAMGVIQTVMRGDKELKCSCLGTIIDVPLSTVSIIEDVGMGIMALIMLF